MDDPRRHWSEREENTRARLAKHLSEWMFDRGIASTADSDWNEFANDDQEKVDEKPDDGGLDSLLDDDFNIDRF